MGKMAKVGAVGLVALGLTAVKMSNTFQTEMLKIRTEGGATSKEFTNMRKGVLNLAMSGQSMGQGPTSLAMGLYHLESMGLRGKKALLGLKMSAEEAAISGASLEDTTTSLGGALFIAAKGTGGLKDVMGSLNAIAGAGNMRFQDLNEALGTGLLGAAKISGVSLQEMGATLDVLTDSGYKASSAGAQLGTALHYLYDPTTKAEGALESIGLTGSKLASDLRKPQGILAAMKDLRSHMKGMSANAQEQLLGSILPGGRGRVLLNLYQLQNRLAPKYQQVVGTKNDFGQHVAEQAANPATKLREAWAKVQAMMVTFGDTLKKYVMPVALLFIGALFKLISYLMAAFNWFVKMNPAAKALGVFVGILATAFIAYRIATTAATVAMGLFNLVMDANPISLVILAIAALAAGFVYAYDKSKTFRDVVGAIWSWLKGAVVNTVGFVKKHWMDIAGILLLPFGGFVLIIANHFSAVKGIVIDILNFILKQVNVVIGVLNSLHISTPFGDIGVPHISPIGLISTGSGATASKATASKVATGGRPKGTTARGFAGATAAFRTAPVSMKDRPMMITGDVVMKVRGKEIGRVTRREMHDAMMG